MKKQLHEPEKPIKHKREAKAEMGMLGGLVAAYLAIGSLTVPIFRSGGRTGLTFWQWVGNHTIFGPPVEYVPEEDYTRELEYSAKAPSGLVPSPSRERLESTMSLFQLSQESAERLLARPVAAGPDTLEQYDDLLANRRLDGRFHSIRGLVQPDEPTVKEVADVLIQAPDFIESSQEFVDTFTTYRRQVGDYWATPAETLAAEAGDCDDKAILLCSILRNYLPADQVFCAVGLWSPNGVLSGHMWAVTEGNMEDRILEATAPPFKAVRGNYILSTIFNDQYCFSTEVGLREFCLIPVSNGNGIRRR